MVLKNTAKTPTSQGARKRGGGGYERTNHVVHVLRHGVHTEEGVWIKPFLRRKRNAKGPQRQHFCLLRCDAMQCEMWLAHSTPFFLKHVPPKGMYIDEERTERGMREGESPPTRLHCTTFETPAAVREERGNTNPALCCWCGDKAPSTRAPPSNKATIVSSRAIFFFGE